MLTTPCWKIEHSTVRLHLRRGRYPKKTKNYDSTSTEHLIIATAVGSLAAKQEKHTEYLPLLYGRTSLQQQAKGVKAPF